MNMLSVVVAVCAMPSDDLNISRFTIDVGAGAGTGGEFTIHATIGQPDAGVHIGGDFKLTGGFWGGGPTASCYPDVNDDDVLDLLDFVAFQQLYLSLDLAADCNEDGVLNLLDFVCFQNVFTTGCTP